MSLLRTVVLAALIAGVSDLETATAHAAQAAVPDACGLFTLDEVNKATGRTFRRARPDKGQGGDGTTCDFISGTDGTLILTLSNSSKKALADFRGLLTRQGQKLEAVNDLGEDAFFWDDRIHFLTGSRMVVIYNGDSRQPSAKVRPMVLALARLAATKLK